MVVCKFFQQGNCRFGQSCRFEHVYGSKYSYQPNQAKTSDSTITDEQLLNMVQADVQSVLQGGQWILSSYAPFKEKPAVPGLPDLSPEEARLWIYESKINNNLDQVLLRINELVQQSKSNYEQLLHPNKATIQMLRALYQGQPTTSPFQPLSSNTTDPNSVFRSAVQNSAVFSKNTPSVFGQASSGTQDLSKSIFAQASQSVFGNQPTTQSVFGQPASPPSVFGQNVNAPSAFGQNTNAPSAFGQNTRAPSIFAQNANIPSVFGQNANSPSVFGQNTNAPSSFGQPSSGFPTQDPSKSLFAQASQNVFGSQQSNNQPVTQTTAASVFSQSPFSNTNQSVSNQNIFQSQNQTVTNVFEQTVDSSIYSKAEDLSEADMEAFKSDKFELGFVPELPPTKSLCVGS